MKKIDEFKQLLKDYEGKELTTKTMINEMGISSYYIGELTHEGIIEKKDRGIYIVKSLSKTGKSKTIIVTNDNNSKTKKDFGKFRDLVLEGSYEKAYDALVECCEYNLANKNHDYDNHCRVYFILLTSILKMKGIRKDLNYDYDEKLLEFYDEPQSDYYESYVNMREAILAGQYKEAHEYLEIYASKESSRHKGNKISTILTKKLLEEVLLLVENKNKSNDLLGESYALIKQKKYEETKNILENLKPYLNAERAKILCGYLIELCQTIIDFQKDETLLLPPKKEYNFTENTSTAHAFKVFMNNKDYVSANVYVDKCYELYKGGFYRLASLLLKDLIDINKRRNYANIPKTEIQELRTKTRKDDGKANRHFNRFLWAMQHLDFDEAYKEIKLNLIYKVDKRTSTYRSSLSLYEMLKSLKEMQESGLPLEEVHNVYLSSDSEQFNFNSAVRKRDWHAAEKFLPKDQINESLTLEAQYLLIKAILRQDKINRQIELTEEDEIKPLSNHLKIVDKEISEKIPLAPKEEEVVEEAREEKVQEVKTIEVYEDDSLKEVLESIKNLELNYKTLYSLIKNREFEEAFALIEREEQNGYSIDDATKELENQTVEEHTNQTSEPEETVSLEETVESPKEEESLEEAAKVDEVVEESPKELKVDPPRELTKKEKHKLAVLESIKEIELNYDNLYDLIYNKRYEQALYLLERERIPGEQPSRLNFNARRLVAAYLHVIRGTLQEVEQKPIDYTQDCFKIFFAAINNRDYFLANEYVTECEDRSRTPQEMHLFKLILNDICEELTRIEDEKLQKEKEEAAKKEAAIQIDSIDKKIFALSNKPEFDDDDILECRNLLQEKVDLSLTHKFKTAKDILVLGAAEAAFMAMNNELNDCHFASVQEKNIDDEEVRYSIDTTSTKVGDVFYDALKCGDLMTVENILTTENWDNFRDKMNNTNLRLLKKLLMYMHEHMDLVSNREDQREEVAKQKVPQELLNQTDKIAYELLDEKGKKEYNKVELLRKLGSLVKRQKYSEALGEIFESDANLAEDQNMVDIITDIVAAKKAVKIESHNLFDKFNEALASGNIEEARKGLIEYSGYITSKSIDRDLTHHRKRIDILERDLKQPNYEEKEKIYSASLAMFYNKREKKHYEQAIELLNKYIELDKDINCKGYILRARAYEKLKQIKEAKIDYKKTLQISPDPTAFMALGKFAYQEGDYERAINFLEQFQAIRPFKDGNVSRMLVTCYNSTGQRDKSVPYNRHLKYLHYANKK